MRQIFLQFQFESIIHHTGSKLWKFANNFSIRGKMEKFIICQYLGEREKKNLIFHRGTKTELGNILQLTRSGASMFFFYYLFRSFSGCVDSLYRFCWCPYQMEILNKQKPIFSYRFRCQVVFFQAAKVPADKTKVSMKIT